MASRREPPRPHGLHEHQDIERKRPDVHHFSPWTAALLLNLRRSFPSAGGHHSERIEAMVGELFAAGWWAAGAGPRGRPSRVTRRQAGGDALSHRDPRGSLAKRGGDRAQVISNTAKQVTAGPSGTSHPDLEHDRVSCRTSPRLRRDLLASQPGLNTSAHVRSGDPEERPLTAGDRGRDECPREPGLAGMHARLAVAAVLRRADRHRSAGGGGVSGRIVFTGR
jgi:hypothetical protein